MIRKIIILFHFSNIFLSAWSDRCVVSSMRQSDASKAFKKLARRLSTTTRDQSV